MDSVVRPKLHGVTLSHGDNAQHDFLIVMLHGFNSSAAIFAPVGEQYWDHVKNAFVFTPNGAVQDGPDRFHWFDFAGKTSDEIYGGVEEACRAVNETVDGYLDRLGLPDRAVFYVGFSQGATIALHAGLTRANRIGGILSFSGQLILQDRLRASVQARPPVCLVHGRDDTTTPVDKMADALSVLMREKIPTSSHVCAGLGHGLNKDAIVHGLRFLKERTAVCR